MIYVFDCDDVLLDWQQGFRNYMSARGVEMADTGPTQWCMSDWIGCSPQAARARVGRFNTSKSFGYLNPMPNAYETIWRLRDRGGMIHVLTSCGNDPARRDARFWNLSTAFDRAGISPFHTLTCLALGQSKAETLFKMVEGLERTIPFTFVEDSFDQAESAAGEGIETLCIRRNHNRAQEAANPDCYTKWIDCISEVV